MSGVGWRLVVEPLMEGAAWSLIRVDDTPGHHLVWAGRLSSTAGLEKDVAAILPDNAADIWSSPLVDPHAELALARRLGAALLPGPLLSALRTQTHVVHTLTIASRGWCAAVPWDLLVVDDVGTRLLERCYVLTEAHPLAGVDRTRADHLPTGDAFREDVGNVGLVVLDPGPIHSDDASLAPLYPAGAPPVLEQLGASDVLVPGVEGMSVAGLAELLGSRRWRRLLYAGHISPGSVEHPGSSALVLADGLDADLLPAHVWLAHPACWPAPPRVALIGCGSGDGRPLEDIGLPLAAFRAGADLVTATRWVVPTDLDEGRPTFTRLVRAVHDAHSREDPVGHLRAWQLTELHRWKVSGEPLHSPLTWAALISLTVPGARSAGAGTAA